MWQTVDYKGNTVKWYEAELIDNIKSMIENYKADCEINCIDARLRSTCFLGGANELGEWIMDRIQENEK